MKRVLTLILSILTLHVFAYQDGRIFLDENFNPIEDLSSAKYYRTVQENSENTFYAEVFYLTDQPQMKGNYLDEALTILHGHCTYFHVNGKLESRGNYDHGKRTGIWERYTLFGDRKSDRYYPSEKQISVANLKTSCMANFNHEGTSLKKYSQANLRFPHQAEILNLTEGKVVINLSIDEFGTITGHEILSTTDFVFNKAAINMVKYMPNWNPALWNGKPISSNFIIKIEFDETTLSQRSSAFQN